MLSWFSRVHLYATLWATACQAPLSMGFSRQEYWSGLPCPPPRDLPNAGIEPGSLTSPALARRFFTISTTWEALGLWTKKLEVTFRECSPGRVISLCRSLYGKDHLGNDVGGLGGKGRKCSWWQGWEEGKELFWWALSIKLYPRRWESQTIFSRWLTSSGLHFIFLMSILFIYLFIYLFGCKGLCFEKQVLLIFIAANGI